MPCPYKLRETGAGPARILAALDPAALQELYRGHVAYALETAVAGSPATLRVETEVPSG